MSDEGITLSDDLIHGMMNLVMDHDEAAAQDMVRALQYFAAVTGYLAADYPGPDEQRDALLDYLHEFTKHVANERAATQEEQQPEPAETQAAAGKTIQDENNPAMGVWKPNS